MTDNDVNDGGPENGTTSSDPQTRWPADVYIARWRRGTPIALDFAVTSGMRDVPGSIQDASSVVTSYEDFKRTYQDTERACVSEGVSAGVSAGVSVVCVCV